MYDTYLVEEARRGIKVMTTYNHVTDEAWHVYPNGLVDRYDMHANTIDWTQYQAMTRWAIRQLAEEGVTA